MRLFPLLPDGFSFTTTITLALLTNGFRVEYLPIDYHARVGRSKIRPIRDTLGFMQLKTCPYDNMALRRSSEGRRCARENAQGARRPERLRRGDPNPDANAADDADTDHDAPADDGTDVGRDDTAVDDSCPEPGLCDCWCGYGGSMYGPCCQYGEAGRIDYWTVPGPGGCPHCSCGFIARTTCEHGCFDEGPFEEENSASCGEEIAPYCGNGTLEPWEDCEPDPDAACTEPGCSVSGRLVTCTPLCRESWSPVCRMPVEICGNGLDDDCDGATDEGCDAECCTDLVDDNGDGTTDCNDPTCDADPACVPCRTGQEMCGDDCDNDLDCRTDAEDEDCAFARGPCLVRCPLGPEICDNSCDDDGDGWVDCTDPDCVGQPGCYGCADWGEAGYLCGDLLDNDCDGLTDACDDGCTVESTVEFCANRLDDDGDGQTDCADLDCRCDVRCTGTVPEACDDGIDNDADTLIDGADWDCPRRCD